MAPKCIDCMSFRTQVVTNRNKHKFKIPLTKKILKRLARDGQVRIFFCKFSRQAQEIYLNSPKVYELEAGSCQLFENVI